MTRTSATSVPYPAQGGALITSSGLTFTTDLGGNVYALNTRTGQILRRRPTGTAIVAPLSTYRVAGQEYVAVEGGQAGNQTTPGLPLGRASRPYQPPPAIRNRDPLRTRPRKCKPERRSTRDRASPAMGRSCRASRAIVTQQMPLTAPGSLKPEQYASIMAYLLAANCVKPAGPDAPFPTSDQPAFKNVTLAGATCGGTTSKSSPRR
jgi:hypothetical protein